jgi:hypothetical protein
MHEKIKGKGLGGRLDKDAGALSWEIHMIDKDRVEKIVMEKLHALEVGHCLDMRSYKRNRSVLFVKLDASHVFIVEDGFEKNEFQVALDALPKLLKKLLKREFPRSRKIRLYDLGLYDDEKMKGMRRKVI